MGNGRSSKLGQSYNTPVSNVDTDGAKISVDNSGPFMTITRYTKASESTENIDDNSYYKRIPEDDWDNYISSRVTKAQLRGYHSLLRSLQDSVAGRNATDIVEIKTEYTVIQAKPGSGLHSTSSIYVSVKTASPNTTVGDNTFIKILTGRAYSYDVTIGRTGALSYHQVSDKAGTMYVRKWDGHYSYDIATSPKRRRRPRKI